MIIFLLFICYILLSIPIVVVLLLYSLFTYVWSGYVYLWQNYVLNNNVEYETEEEFNADGTFTRTKNDKAKGIILYYVRDGKPVYEYAPWGCSQSEFDEWNETIMNQHKNDTWIKNLYWYLDEVSCVLVLRNKEWFNESIGYIHNIWNQLSKL